MTIVNKTGIETEGAARPPQRGQKTILLVDDDPAILAVTTELLEMAGYSVLKARTASDAIRLATTHSGELHLLLTDVVMPEMNGWNLSECLLSLKADLKCLFMSGYTADIIAQHDVSDGRVNFIEKPFSPQSLLAKVLEVMESK